MLFRKPTVSDECMKWLEKADSFEVTPNQAKHEYEKKCARIQDDVLNALTTVSKEPASPDGKTEIVVEVRLARARKLDTTMVITTVYAVVYTKKDKKYYIMLDQNGQLKKTSDMGDDMFISKDGGEFFEQMQTVESKNYRISMWRLAQSNRSGLVSYLNVLNYWLFYNIVIEYFCVLII